MWHKFNWGTMQHIWVVKIQYSGATKQTGLRWRSMQPVFVVRQLNWCDADVKNWYCATIPPGCSSGRCLRCIWIIPQLGLILNYWSTYRNKIGSCELYLASRPRHPRRKCIKITSTDTQTSRHINCSNVFVQNWTQHKRVKHEIEIVL